MKFFGNLFGGSKASTNEVEFNEISHIKMELESYEKKLYKDETHRKDILKKINLIMSIHKNATDAANVAQKNIESLNTNPDALAVPDGFPLLLKNLNLLLFRAVELNSKDPHFMNPLFKDESDSIKQFETLSAQIIKTYVRKNYLLNYYVGSFHSGSGPEKSDMYLDWKILKSINDSQSGFSVLVNYIESVIKKHFAFLVTVWYLQTWEQTVEVLSQEDNDLKIKGNALLTEANNLVSAVRSMR